MGGISLPLVLGYADVVLGSYSLGTRGIRGTCAKLDPRLGILYKHDQHDLIMHVCNCWLPLRMPSPD